MKGIRKATTKQAADQFEEVHFLIEGADISGICSCGERVKDGPRKDFSNYELVVTYKFV